jgi:hypothetical protein
MSSENSAVAMDTTSVTESPDKYIELLEAAMRKAITGLQKCPGKRDWVTGEWTIDLELRPGSKLRLMHAVGDLDQGLFMPL